MRRVFVKYELPIHRWSFFFISIYTGYKKHYDTWLKGVSGVVPLHTLGAWSGLEVTPLSFSLKIEAVSDCDYECERGSGVACRPDQTSLKTANNKL